MKIERLLAITVMLLIQRKVTANQLADHFEVSKRTIYRDLETLNRAGIPVISSQGYEGGFCIPDNFKISRQLLTYDDMVSILLTLKGVNSTLENRDITRVIEKITALIPEDKKGLYKQQSDSFVIDIMPWGSPKNLTDTMQLVHRAIAENRLLQFDYVNNKGEKSFRKTEPHTLVFKSFNWYLLAFCKLRGEFRVFRLSRMSKPVMAQAQFSRRPFDLNTHFQFAGDSQQGVDISLQFSQKARFRAEEIFPQENLKVNADGSVIATFTASESDWILSFVLSFGENVLILSPAGLRNLFKEKVDTIKKLYRNLP